MSFRDAVIGGSQLLAGIAAAYLLYVYVGYDDSPWSLSLLLSVAAVAFSALASFAIARRLFMQRWSRVLAGLALCYTTIAFLLLVLMPSPEERMWLPVLLVFGVVCTAPAVAGAWFASGNCFVVGTRGDAQQAVTADRLKTGAG
jgi:hypothetical protein